MVTETGGNTEEVQCFFMAHPPDSPYERERVAITWKDIETINPVNWQFPEVANPTGLRLLHKLSSLPTFDSEGPWNIDWMNEIHRGADRDLFANGKSSVPLVEADTFNQFDAVYGEPSVFLKPTEWRAHIESKTGDRKQQVSERLVFRAIARNTDARTVIAARVPPGCGVAHSAWVERVDGLSAEGRMLLEGLMNSLVFDFLATAKRQSECD